MRLTASALGLLPYCKWPFRSDTPPAPYEPPSKAADFGTAIHAVCEEQIRRLNGEAVHSMAPVLSFRKDAKFQAVMVQAKRWVAEHWREGWKPEQAFAYQSGEDEARALNISRRGYPVSAASVVMGTADVVHVETDRVDVYDFKTGHSPPSAYDAQLDGLAVMAARAYNKRRVRTIVVQLGEYGVEPTTRGLDGLELDGIAAEMAANVAAIPGAPATPGAWCDSKYCKYRRMCPAYKEMKES